MATGEVAATVEERARRAEERPLPRGVVIFGAMGDRAERKLDGRRWRALDDREKN